MSVYFDLVINCDLKENVSEGAIEAIRSLTQRDYIPKTEPDLIIPEYGNMWDIMTNHHCLAPDPERDVISNFRCVYRTTTPNENGYRVYRYRLQYCGSSIHSDYFYQNHLPLISWLATVAYEDYIGYHMETHRGAGGHEVRHLRIENGKLMAH